MYKLYIHIHNIHIINLVQSVCIYIYICVCVCIYIYIYIYIYTYIHIIYIYIYIICVYGNTDYRKSEKNNELAVQLVTDTFAALRGKINGKLPLNCSCLHSKLARKSMSRLSFWGQKKGPESAH